MGRYVLIEGDPGAELLTLGQASRMLGVHPSTLKRWTLERGIPCQRTMGGHRRYTREVVERLVAGDDIADIVGEQ